jgi:hypothetical protein
MLAGRLVCATMLGTTAASAGHPRPLPEGPAGPPARLPDGRIARPPRLPGPASAARCRRAAYGPKFYAPGSGKTVALTFDDGPGKSTRNILRLLRKYRVPATFFNLGVNAAARPHLLSRELARGYVLGNHTWDHRDLADLSAAGQAMRNSSCSCTTSPSVIRRR